MSDAFHVWQELSVWAGGANIQHQQQQQQAVSWADPRASSAEATGMMARSLMAAYQELQSVMEALSTIMMQHQALKVRGWAGRCLRGCCLSCLLLPQLSDEQQQHGHTKRGSGAFCRNGWGVA